MDTVTRENSIMKRLAAVLVALGLLTFGMTVRPTAHEGHDHKVMGTVTMAAADHVMLKARDGKDVTIQVTKDTKVRSRPAIKVEEIKAGTRVVVTATQKKDGTFTARTIEVGAVPAASK
jgi:hypothetical protein